MTVSSVWTVSPRTRRVVGTVVFSGPSEARARFCPYSASGVISEIAADDLREALQAAIPAVTWRVTAGPQIGSTVGGPVGHLLILGDAAFTAEEPETEEEAAALVAALEKVKAEAEAAAAIWAQNNEAMRRLLESVEAS